MSLLSFKDSMTGRDYAEHLILHLVDNLDCINAKLVYLRAPDVFKKKGELITAWTIYQALESYSFAEALKLLSDSDALHMTLKRFLQ